MPYEKRWQGDRSLLKGVVYGDGSAYEGQDVDLCVAGWGIVANTAARLPVTVSGTLPFLIQDVDGAKLFAGGKPPRPPRRRGRTCGVTYGA